MKLINICIFVFLLSACSNLHLQSTLHEAASITVQNPRVVEGEKYRPFVAINIDGKRAVRTQEDYERDPQSSFVKVLVDPGFHEVKIEVTAYNGSRAKYEHETIELKFAAYSRYELVVEIPEEVSESIKSDSWAKLRFVDVSNNLEVLNKKILLKDNALRSIAEGPIFIPI